MNISQAINEIIEKSTWNKSRLAACLGIKNQGLNNRLKANKSMRVDSAIEIADVLGYELMLVPKGTRRPDNSIALSLTEPIKEKKAVGRPKKNQE